MESCYDDEGDLIIKIYDHAVEFEVFVLMREAGGDKVSKTLLGAYNYFKNIKTEKESNKVFVLDKISKCNASIGINGKPEYSEKHKHFEYIMSLALCFDGIIFNGSGAVNECGELILGLDGEYSVEISPK